MRRSYTRATVVSQGEGFGIALDDRPVRTPAGRPLVVTVRPLAEAMAAEWAVQADAIRPDSMPLTQLANTAIDRVAPNRAAIVAELVRYGQTDLVCYRAEATHDLVERQERLWQPIVDWASVNLGAEMVVTSGVVPVPQPDASLAILEKVIETYDDMRLTALQSTVSATGSLLLGLALIEGELGAEEVYVASQLDELFQSELWGEDDEAVSRRAALRKEVFAAARFLEFCAARDA